MKHVSTKLIITFIAICTGFGAAAHTWTVNNTTLPVAPGQYSTITAAIAAASSGDTVIVAGSPTPYDFGTITLNKPLVMIGAGYNPQGANTYTTSIVQIFQFSPAASGSTIMGFVFGNQVVTIASGVSSFHNITFERNYFNYTHNIALAFNVGDSCYNINIINNIFGNYSGLAINPSWSNNNFVYNNVFLLDGSTEVEEYSIYYTGSTTLTIDHNLFLSGSHSNPSPSDAYLEYDAAYYCPSNNSLISNNIFYNVQPYASVYIGAYSNILYNNISYAGAGSVETMTTGISSDNINNINPMLDSIFSSPTLLFNFAVDNISLKSGSPAINAGSDGSNIGPTGGLYPIYNTNANYLTGEPPVPEVTNLSVTGSTTITTGGTLNVTVTAVKKN